MARSTFATQKVKHEGLGAILEVRMPKMGGRCGAKHICNSKCTKHERFGALLEVPMSQMCPTDEIDRSILI